MSQYDRPTRGNKKPLVTRYSLQLAGNIMQQCDTACFRTHFLPRVEHMIRLLSRRPRLLETRPFRWFDIFDFRSQSTVASAYFGRSGSFGSSRIAKFLIEIDSANPIFVLSPRLVNCILERAILTIILMTFQSVIINSLFVHSKLKCWTKQCNVYSTTGAGGLIQLVQ